MKIVASVTAVAVLALIGMSACGKARAGDHFRGFAMDHQFRPRPSVVVVPYGFYPPRYDGDYEAYRVGGEATEAEKAKAVADQKTCAPVVLYTEQGVVRQPASGCRR